MKLGNALSLVILVTMASCSSWPTVPLSDLSKEIQWEDHEGWLVLRPSSVPLKAVGLVFYPGGLVKPEAYLPALSRLAADGWGVAVPRMPFDLAFFDVNKGFKGPGKLPEIGRWVVGGHSLGGVAASIAVRRSPAAFHGLLLWASYPGTDDDLSGWSRPALSISASLDGLSTPAKLEAANHRLPPGTEHFVVEGGNHAQFADYGVQRGDGTAVISRMEQQKQVIQRTEEFLEKVATVP